MNNNELHLGERLKSLISDKGKTVAHFTRYLDLSSRQLAYDMFKRPDMSFKHLVKSCEFLEVTLDEFLKGAYSSVVVSEQGDITQLIKIISRNHKMIDDKLNLIISREK